MCTHRKDESDRYKIVAKKPEGNIPHERHRHIEKDNIIMDIKRNRVER
jgi:hypothetical protein